MITAWFKKGSGIVVQSTLRAVSATIPDPFLNYARNNRRLHFDEMAQRRAEGETMKRISWISLPLVCVLGCHHNLQPEPSCKSCGPKHGHGAAADPGVSGPRRFANSSTQITFVSPVGMKIGWESSMGQGMKNFLPAQLTVPGRYNFAQGAIYRLKVTEVPAHPGVPFYPTLEVAPSSPRTDAYITHNAVPIEFTDEDFDQVSSGNFVSKVIYLPDPQHQELAIAGVETLVSTRLDPGVDPVAEADRRGTILAIVRLGGIDLEMPQQMRAQSGMMPCQTIQMTQHGMPMFSQMAASDQSGQAIIQRW